MPRPVIEKSENAVYITFILKFPFIPGDDIHKFFSARPTCNRRGYMLYYRCCNLSCPKLTSRNHMLAHISTSFWSAPRNIGVGLCQPARAEQSRAEQSRAEQSRGNTALLAVCSEDCQADKQIDDLNGCEEQQGHTLLKEETYIASLPLHAWEMRGKGVSFSKFRLDFA